MNNFLLGFGVGLTIAVLFAPRTGDETREYLGGKASDGADYLSGQAQQLKNTASDLVERGRNILADQKDKLTKTAENVQEQAQRA
jgi:gas vesicle protein